MKFERNKIISSNLRLFCLGHFRFVYAQIFYAANLNGHLNSPLYLIIRFFFFYTTNVCLFIIIIARFARTSSCREGNGSARYALWTTRAAAAAAHFICWCSDLYCSMLARNACQKYSRCGKKKEQLNSMHTKLFIFYWNIIFGGQMNIIYTYEVK